MSKEVQETVASLCNDELNMKQEKKMIIVIFKINKNTFYWFS